MVWNSTWPIGSISVKANRTTGNQNTTYIETTMGNSIVGTNTDATRDHFWDVDANLDGRHRFINSVGFTEGGNPADPVIGASMDGVLYLKSDGLTPAKVTGWFRNSGNAYQYMPALLTGTWIMNSSTSTYVNIASVPNDTFGEIFMYNFNSDTNSYIQQSGYFIAKGGQAQAWAYSFFVAGSGSVTSALKFGNGSEAGSGLNVLTLRAKRHTTDTPSANADWKYIIYYRKIF